MSNSPVWARADKSSLAFLSHRAAGKASVGTSIVDPVVNKLVLSSVGGLPPNTTVRRLHAYNYSTQQATCVTHELKIDR